MKTLILFVFIYSTPQSFSTEWLYKLKKGKQLIHKKAKVVADRIYKINLQNNDQIFLRSDDVEWFQENHQLSKRTEPNDIDFLKQWNFVTQPNGADIKIGQVWDKGTGGKDRKGRDIVVAVVDSGVAIEHKDLEQNIWFNQNEKADNNIDDDQNGYIDDVYGWNAATQSGEMSESNHGTHVAGIIGAVGNNKLQISGINWGVKVMPLVLGTFKTDEVLRAYQYIVDQKKLWLESKGEKGANIVATNSSFGIDYANCNSGEYPAWNDIYNEMGKYGILSAAATINSDVDVDKEGDVPTGCSSPYIVSVTNTTLENKKYNSAGYGAKSIDIGAPGTNILSTVTENALDEYTGTSMATPHIAGSIALLFSFASDEFLEEYERSPDKAVLQLKAILLKNTDSLEDLEGKTVSGGKVNLEKSLNRL